MGNIFCHFFVSHMFHLCPCSYFSGRHPLILPVLKQTYVSLTPPPLSETDLYTQISKQLVNKTLLIVEDCNKQDEKGRKRKVKGGKYERRLKKCQGTHKKEEKIFPPF